MRYDGFLAYDDMKKDNVPQHDTAKAPRKIAMMRSALLQALGFFQVSDIIWRLWAFNEFDISSRRYELLHFQDDFFNHFRRKFRSCRSYEPLEISAKLLSGEPRLPELRADQLGDTLHFVGIDGEGFAAVRHKPHPFQIRNVRPFDGGFHQIVAGTFSEIEEIPSSRTGGGFRFSGAEVVQIGREERERAQKEKIGLELAERPVVGRAEKIERTRREARESREFQHLVVSEEIHEIPFSAARRTAGRIDRVQRRRHEKSDGSENPHVQQRLREISGGNPGDCQSHPSARDKEAAYRDEGDKTDHAERLVHRALSFFFLFSVHGRRG